MSNYTFTLNMIPNTGTPVVVNLSQGDIGRELTFKLVEGSDPNITIATDASAITIEGLKPSGLGFTETCTATSGNTITVSTTEAMTQESGMIPAEVRFVAGTKDLGTANIIFAIEESPHPAGTTDGTQDTMQNLETRLQGEIDDLDDRVTVLEEAEDSGLTQEEKNLILTLFNKAAYTEDDAKTSYDALEALWRTVYRSITYNLTNCRSSNNVTSIENGKGYSTALSVMGGYSITTVSVTMGGTDVTSQYYHSGSISIPRVTGDVVITAVATKSVNSITATYTQSGTVYDTDTLDSLKSDLVVIANYSDSTTETVTDYTLSGTLAEGTSTITVSYGGKTASFNVTVTHQNVPSGYTEYDYIYKSTSGNIKPIVTDAQLASDYTVEMRYKYPSGTYANPLSVFGTKSKQWGGSKEIALFITQSTGKLGYWYANTDTKNEIFISADTVHSIKILPVGKSTTYPSNAVIDVDGTEYDTGSTASGETWSAWFGIFGYAYSATNTEAGADFSQIGEIIIKDANDDVVYDFVPVSRNDNKNGFYETVNGTFYEATSMTVGNWE